MTPAGAFGGLLGGAAELLTTAVHAAGGPLPFVLGAVVVFASVRLLRGVARTILRLSLAVAALTVAAHLAGVL